MTDTELKKLTLSSAVDLIATKKISSDELVAAVLSRIERLNPEMRAFITVMRNKKESTHKPPLLGVPISVKDLYDTKSVRTTAGAKVFENRLPEEDATAVKKLSAAGAVVIGKTNMHEFAFGVTTVNPHYGVARNPWDPRRISGGSSGGSASSVALGMGFGSLGSDTGGSIRIPAALCGIVGLKPTYGRVSLKGVVPLSWSFDHAGPMARTVKDVAMLLEVIAGHDPLDPYSRNVAVPRYTDALTGSVKGIRVGTPNNYFYERLAPPVEKAIQKAVRDFEKLGARIVPIEMPGLGIHRATWLQIASPEAYSYHEFHLQKYASLYGADVRGRLEAGRTLLSIDYVRAQRARTLIKRECKELFDHVDVIVTPTVPIVAPLVEEAQIAAILLPLFTRYFNVTGLPAISIPCGFSEEGLPIGMQIVGKAFDESTVLRVAQAYEQEMRWFERIPTT